MSHALSAADLMTAVATDPGAVSTRLIDRHARAHDASHYLLLPSFTAVAADALEVGRFLRVASRHGIPLTFRSGGTSLSGQAVTDGMLLDVRRNFRRIDVLDSGARVRAQPGATLRAVNSRLARHGRKLGPDPASEIACTIGGIVANNSSGMTCGVEGNAARTLRSAVLVLASGSVIDTSAADADAMLAAREPVIADGLRSLRYRVRANPESVATIRRLFSMKNTMGYALDAFLRHDGIADLLAHLIVGSEGTLAFVADAEFETVPLKLQAATGLLVFPDLVTAAGALPDLVASGAAAIELLDERSLRVASADPAAPELFRAFDIERHAALLVEYAAASTAEASELAAAGGRLAASLPVSAPARFSSDPAARAGLWAVRKGLYAAVAGARPSGTLALLEDIVVPQDRLAAMCARLETLFVRYGYDEAVVFGHARDGNLHFMLTDRFDEPERRATLAAFTEELVDGVLAEGGSLKAEHGTGRAMAPFVERQYGAELYDVMRELKQLLDPAGVLNPGVIISDDPEAHLRDLKVSTAIEAEADSCVECGYCETVCPSKDLTLTPRQRIVVRRAAKLAAESGDVTTARELDRQYDYEALETCAVDGMCQTACPVKIDTGALVKTLRAREVPKAADAAWDMAARAWAPVTSIAGRALDVVPLLPRPIVSGANTVARALAGNDAVPRWSPDLPRGGSRRARPRPVSRPDAVYLPACVGSMFGPAGDGPGVQSSLERLAALAGVTLAVPPGVDGLCCGTPWSSKGLVAGRDRMRERLGSVLGPLATGVPVVVDASSCTEGAHAALAGIPGVRVVDAVDFVLDAIVPRLPTPHRVEVLAVHPTCSTTRLGTTARLLALASHLADEVRVPDDWGCCGFAGDRGMLHPELTASATGRQAAQVRQWEADAHVSCNRTCEMGMTRATGREYRHIVELLDELTPDR